jgi:TPR repeat protein
MIDGYIKMRGRDHALKMDEAQQNHTAELRGYSTDSGGYWKNNPEYLFHEYQKFFKAERFSQALEKLLLSSTKGFPNAEFELGKLYYVGSEQLQLSKNFLKAFEYFYDAADKGHALAQYHLGFMYFKGEGIATDMKQAISWLHQSANQGVNEALDLLGRIYHLGYDVISPDYKKAEKFFQDAVNHYYAPSMFHYALLLEELQRYEEACELINKSAGLGHPQAIINYMCTFK